MTEFFLGILVSVKAITSKLIFVDYSRFWSSSKVLVNEWELMWNRDTKVSLLGIFNFIIHLCHNIYFELNFLDHFSFREWHSGWFQKQRTAWVSLLVIVLLLPMKFRKFYLFKLPNGKSVLVQERQYHGSLQPCRYL